MTGIPICLVHCTVDDKDSEFRGGVTSGPPVGCPEEPGKAVWVWGRGRMVHSGLSVFPSITMFQVIAFPSHNPAVNQDACVSSSHY